MFLTIEKDKWLTTNIDKSEFTTWAITKLQSKNSILLDSEIHIIKKEITNLISLMDDHTFKRFKSRWSTFKARTKNKSLSIDINNESYEKLEKIKGQHSMKGTIEAMINIIYSSQTHTNEASKRKTTKPLLDSIKINNEETDLNLVHTLLTFQAKENIGRLLKLTDTHRMKINNLTRRIIELENPSDK